MKSDALRTNEVMVEIFRNAIVDLRDNNSPDMEGYFSGKVQGIEHCLSMLGFYRSDLDEFKKSIEAQRI